MAVAKSPTTMGSQPTSRTSWAAIYTASRSSPANGTPGFSVVRLADAAMAVGVRLLKATDRAPKCDLTRDLTRGLMWLLRSTVSTRPAHSRAVVSSQLIRR